MSSEGCGAGVACSRSAFIQSYRTQHRTYSVCVTRDTKCPPLCQSCNYAWNWQESGSQDDRRSWPKRSGVRRSDLGTGDWLHRSVSCQAFLLIVRSPPCTCCSSTCSCCRSCCRDLINPVRSCCANDGFQGCCNCCAEGARHSSEGKSIREVCNSSACCGSGHDAQEANIC